MTHGPALVTGATGFLGSALTAHLLETEEDDVFCLVRPKDGQPPVQRLVESLTGYALWQPEWAGRVHVITGDLAEPALGLSDSDRRRLVDEVARVFHCGAVVNAGLPYARTRGPNVSGTAEVLRLASTGRPKQVAHVSTSSVLWSTANAGQTVDETTPMSGPDGIPAGYMRSKWDAEQLTAEARGRGLDVRTFRLGPLGGHTRTGASNTAGMRWLMLRVCAELGLAPVLGARDWWLSWAPVDFVSAAIVALTAAPPAEPDIYHLVERNEVPWPQVFSWMRRKGYKLAMADVRRWQERVLAAVGDSGTSIGFFAASIDADDHGRPVLPAKVLSTLTDDRLAEMGMRCPELTAELFGFYLDVGVRQGILPPPS